MAGKVSLEVVEANQAKMNERLDALEETLHEMFQSYVELYGEQVPAGLRKKAKAWQKAKEKAKEDEGVVVKPVVCFYYVILQRMLIPLLSPITLHYIIIKRTSTPFQKKVTKKGDPGGLPGKSAGASSSATPSKVNVLLRRMCILFHVGSLKL